MNKMVNLLVLSDAMQGKGSGRRVNPRHPEC
jgi:hypothetical protein